MLSAVSSESGEQISAVGFRHRHVVVPLTLRCVTILGVAAVIYKQQLPTVYCCWILRGVETGAGLE